AHSPLSIFSVTRVIAPACCERRATHTSRLRSARGRHMFFDEHQTIVSPPVLVGDLEHRNAEYSEGMGRHASLEKCATPARGVHVRQEILRIPAHLLRDLAELRLVGRIYPAPPDSPIGLRHVGSRCIFLDGIDHADVPALALQALREYEIDAVTRRPA